MSLKKVSITLNSEYLNSLKFIILSGKSGELEFSGYEIDEKIFLFPVNFHTDSLLNKYSDFYLTKIKINFVGDELNALLDAPSMRDEKRWNWDLQKHKFSFSANWDNSESSISEKKSFIRSLSGSMIFFGEVGSFPSVSYAHSLGFYVSSGNQSPDWNEEIVFSRNLLWMGTENFSKIRNIKIGCIGAGGIMNPFVVQAMHHGYKNFTLIDGDKIELHNLNRFLGGKKQDLGSQKVKVLFDILKKFDSEINVDCVAEYFPHDDGIKNIISCDIIVAGVDNDYTRLQLQLFALALQKPYLDMGSGIILKDNNSLIPIVDERGGQVKLYVPGFACIACMGINLQNIMEPDFKGLNIRNGYITGTELTPPSIISLNTTIAAMGLKLLTDYITTGTTVRHLKYSENNFKLYTVNSNHNENCRVCGKS